MGLAEVNKALNSASTEINKLLNQLNTSNAGQKKAEEELAATQAELEAANSKHAASEQKMVGLVNDLDKTKALLSKSTEQAQNTSKRLTDLEKQVSEKAVWENKYKVAEQERVKLDQRLKALRTALQALTVATPNTPVPVVTKPAPVAAKPAPVAAEVVSNEIIAATPSPELPPPYKATPAKNHPAPTALELKRQEQLQQLRDMGFHLTVEQLDEKLAQHGGNMEHVVHSLL